jgi:hypothetical protein
METALYEASGYVTQAGSVDSILPVPADPAGRVEILELVICDGIFQCLRKP